MSNPIRRELELARLAARERRLRLVIQILGARDAEHRRAQDPTPPALRESIADFGRQLGEIRRRQAELGREAPPVRPSTGPPARRSGRFDSRGAGDRAGNPS